MRDKLRLKIRQRIHNLPSEGGDENMNTLNQTESVRTRRNHGGKVSSRDEVQVSMFPFISLSYNVSEVLHTNFAPEKDVAQLILIFH